MDWSRIFAVLAFVVQIGNAAVFFLQGIAPEYAVIIAAVVAAIQAFTARIQGTNDR